MLMSTQTFLEKNERTISFRFFVRQCLVLYIFLPILQNCSLAIFDASPLRFFHSRAITVSGGVPRICVENAENWVLKAFYVAK